MAAGLLAGSAQVAQQKKKLDLPSWFIESYDGGVITVKHAGKTYKAKCEGHHEYKPEATVYPTCTMAIYSVGRVLPQATFDDLRFLVMQMFEFWGSLGIREKDEVETFTITSVTTNP